MSSITFKGTPVTLAGSLPPVGQSAPDFSVVDNAMQEVKLSDYKGKNIILNIFPSIDTPVCALQLKKFSAQIADDPNNVLIFVSLDLPFALRRFCAIDNIKNAITTSDFRHLSVGQSYGVKMLDGPMAGLYARAVMVIDEQGIVRYSELVAELTDEPIYEQSLLQIDALD